MDALLLAIICGAALLTAYLTYGRWVARRVFQLREDSPTPAVLLEDGRDYCPTSRWVVFGHHFTSIAGTGPIVGPAIAVMWGWLPAIIWVVLGSIFIGAVHDLGSLVVSLRNRGRSIGDVAGDLLGPRARLIFLLTLIVGLWIVLAVFGLVIASVLRAYPAAIFPVLVQIPLAILIGALIHRKGRSLVIPSLLALALMYLSVVLGDWGPLHAFNQTLAAQPIWLWTVGLLAYAYVASVLPVWTLLQPRDYINALQLLTALGLLMAGVVGAALLGSTGPDPDGERRTLELVAPMVHAQPAGAPPIIPMLFITIACGAISGFHCLVGSGTTSKQIRCERDARAVGFGSMLTEGWLATLVIIACAAGLGLGAVRSSAAGETALLTGAAAWNAQYTSWGAAGALSATVGAFVEGAANMIGSLGMPFSVAVALMGVLVASFAATTMDTACRLQRYVLQEFSATFLPRTDIGAPDPTAASPLNPFRHLATTHGATLFAVVTAAILAAIPPEGMPWSLENSGKGGMRLWPLFGATNQLLAGLAFVVIVAWLTATNRPRWFIIPPALLMLALPAWALAWQAFIGNSENLSWLAQRNWALVSVACIALALEAWLVVEASLRFVRGDALRALAHAVDGAPLRA